MAKNKMLKTNTPTKNTNKLRKHYKGKEVPKHRHTDRQAQGQKDIYNDRKTVIQTMIHFARQYNECYTCNVCYKIK